MKIVDDVYYSFISDDDGHLYIVPWDKLEEAQKYFEDISSYYAKMDYSKDEPVRPDFIMDVGGAISNVKFKSPRW